MNGDKQLLVFILIGMFLYILYDCKKDKETEISRVKDRTELEIKDSLLTYNKDRLFLYSQICIKQQKYLKKQYLKDDSLMGLIFKLE